MCNVQTRQLTWRDHLWLRLPPKLTHWMLVTNTSCWLLGHRGSPCKVCEGRTPEMRLWRWVKRHVKVDTWSKGEYFLGLALEQDEWSFELHLVKLIFRLKCRPAKEG